MRVRTTGPSKVHDGRVIARYQDLSISRNEITLKQELGPTLSTKVYLNTEAKVELAALLLGSIPALTLETDIRHNTRLISLLRMVGLVRD